MMHAAYTNDDFVRHTNSTDTIYNYLSKRFVLDSSFKDDMREVGKDWGPIVGDRGYNEADDTFLLPGPGSMGYARVLGYLHNSGNKYTVYYSFEENGLDPTTQLYKVVLEFNRTDCWDPDAWKLNGEENQYLSFEKVTSTPSDMIK